MKTQTVTIVILGFALCSCGAKQDNETDQTDGSGDPGGAVQTTWSGGPEVAGPVSDWSDRFESSDNVAWAEDQGGLMLGPGIAMPHDVTTTFGEPAGVVCADLDGDNDQDIASVSFIDHEVAWFENDGNGGEFAKHVIATDFTGTVSLCAVDMDGDDDLDIAATAEEGHTVSWWANDGTGGGWTETVIDDAVGGPFSVRAADFDGDGDPDLVSAVYFDNQVVWYENNGDGSEWTKHIFPESAPGAWCAIAADMDGDQDPDIAAGANNANSVFWYENNGDASKWTKHVIDNAFPSPKRLRAKDINGDQLIDVAAVSNSGQLVWWENDGKGGWLKKTVTATLLSPSSIWIEDLDGDGDWDLLTNERNGDRLWWYENALGAGEFWIPHLLDEGSDGPGDVTAAFIDSDGSIDVVGSFSWDHAVRWYQLSDTFSQAGELVSSILDLGAPVTSWEQIEWDCEAPAGTSVQIEVRGSANAKEMGDWMIVSASGDSLSDYLTGGEQYFQYRLTFESSDDTFSPRFDGISIHFEN